MGPILNLTRLGTDHVPSPSLASPVTALRSASDPRPAPTPSTTDAGPPKPPPKSSGTDRPPKGDMRAVMPSAATVSTTAWPLSSFSRAVGLGPGRAWPSTAAAAAAGVATAAAAVEVAAGATAAPPPPTPPPPPPPPPPAAPTCLRIRMFPNAGAAVTTSKPRDSCNARAGAEFWSTANQSSAAPALRADSSAHAMSAAPTPRRRELGTTATDCTKTNLAPLSTSTSGRSASSASLRSVIGRVCATPAYSPSPTPSPTVSMASAAAIPGIPNGAAPATPAAPAPAPAPAAAAAASWARTAPLSAGATWSKKTFVDMARGACSDAKWATREVSWGGGVGVGLDSGGDVAGGGWRSAVKSMLPESTRRGRPRPPSCRGARPPGSPAAAIWAFRPAAKPQRSLLWPPL